MFVYDIFAQNMINIEGRVYDFKTRTDLVGASVQIMDADSNIIASTIASSFTQNGNIKKYNSSFWFSVPKKNNVSYIIKTSMVGYKTSYTDIAFTKMSKKQLRKELPPILMKEENIMLNNVQVSATKIKFYYKGDTVVYNADAFMLAEGSMLDALVRQLPGVEMRSNGDIYHEGKLIKNLLLNGKDFFKSDKKIMLDNLPTYMVKNVKVYDKRSDKAEFLGTNEPEDKSYVMDVCLKKEYSIGYISNTELGSGLANKTSNNLNPYLGRLFAMRFTDHSSIGIYFNANNVNDDRRPGQTDNWLPSKMPEGRRKEQLAGIDYNVDARNKRWKLHGEANFSHSIFSNEKNMYRTNFLTFGETYERIQNADKMKDLKLNTAHDLTVTSKTIMLTIHPTLDYIKYDNNSQMFQHSYSDTTINKYNSDYLKRGFEWNTGVSLKSTVKIADTYNYVDWGAETSYGKKRNDEFNRFSLQLGRTERLTNSSDRYIKNKPNCKLFMKAFASYHHRINGKWFASLEYSITHSANKDYSYMYLLDKLQNYETKDLGVLPSVMDYEKIIDSRNSYEQRISETTHCLVPHFRYGARYKDGSSLVCQVFFPLSILSQRLDYIRGEIDTTIIKRPILLGTYGTYAEWKSKDNNTRIYLGYQLIGKTPDLLNHVNMHDDRDPLNIKEGTPNLKNSYEHKYLLTFRKRSKVTYGFQGTYNAISNAIAMGYYYSANGIRTYKAYNVNGNWNAGLLGVLQLYLDKTKRYMLTNYASLGHIQNVDLHSQDIFSDMIESKVLTEKVSNQTSLKYDYGKVSISLDSKFDYQRIHSPRIMFTNMNVFDYYYGIKSVFALPWQVQLATDITMYSRRGYSSTELNTDDFVWNVRISKSVMKGRLVFMLDGFDILGNLSNVDFSLNGQGRMEIRRNVLPSYAMFHVQYKLDKQPHKK